ncbi:hypothetical protein TWF173_011377 [Orbilia oligospora]|nr:hypothetical protein TWF173_011377 [Orbilia oligospora]
MRSRFLLPFGELCFLWILNKIDSAFLDLLACLSIGFLIQQRGVMRLFSLFLLYVPARLQYLSAASLSLLLFLSNVFSLSFLCFMKGVQFFDIRTVFIYYFLQSSSLSLSLSLCLFFNS